MCLRRFSYFSNWLIIKKYSMYHIISLNWCDAHCTIHGKCYILVTMEVMFWTQHQIVLRPVIRKRSVNSG